MADLTLERSETPGPSSSERPGASASAGGATRPPPPGAGAPIGAPSDARAVRVAIGAGSILPGEEAVVVALPQGPLTPPEVPLTPPGDTLAGSGPLGGVAADRMPADETGTEGSGTGSDALVISGIAPAAVNVVVDGEPTAVSLVRRGPDRASLVVGEGSTSIIHRIVFAGEPARGRDGMTRREVLVDGWRFEVELEPERRAALRERARRGREATAHGGPTEVRAIIPGRLVAVSVAPGDAVTAGQQVLVVEAMKMQNELRAPRDGTIRKVAVEEGVTIEVGDLLLVIE